MTTWRRQIGYVDDSVAGGSAYDDLVAGAIPDAASFIPVRTANITGDPDPLERNAEVRGFRGDTPPNEFRSQANVTLTSEAYSALVKKLIRLWAGTTDVRSGAPPAAITHKFLPIQSGDLPAVHMGVVRDEQYDKVAGCTANSVTLDFPYLEAGTIEAELRGKYRSRVATAPPATSYAQYGRRGWYLRDAQVLLGGALTPLDNLRGVRVGFDNRFADPEYWPRRNRVVTSYGSPAVKRTVWWPQRQKFMSHAITGQLITGTPTPDIDLQRELAHAEQFVLEIELEDLGTTPAAKELIRITAQNKVITGGGPEALTDEDELTATYDFTLFVDPASGTDTKVEFVDASNVNIT
jgi:hypothetical protein